MKFRGQGCLPLMRIRWNRRMSDCRNSGLVFEIGCCSGHFGAEGAGAEVGVRIERLVCQGLRPWRRLKSY